MCTDRAEKRRTAFAAALASAVLPLCAAEETQQRIFPGATTQADADAADAAAVARQGSVGRDTSRSPERTPLIIAAAYAPPPPPLCCTASPCCTALGAGMRTITSAKPRVCTAHMHPPSLPSTLLRCSGAACSVCIAVLLLGCLLCYKRRRSSANSTKHRACPSGAAAVSRLCSPDLRAGFLDAALPHHATTIQLRELQQDLLRLRPPPAFEIMAESAWLEMVHSQQIADCDGSSYERCIQRCDPHATIPAPLCGLLRRSNRPSRACRTQDLQFWGSFTESMRMAPQPRNTRFSAHDALSLGPFDVQLKLTFYPPDTDMEPEVEMQVDSIVARGVAKGLVWGVRGCAVEGDAAYEICGVYNAKTGRCERCAACSRQAAVDLEQSEEEASQRESSPLARRTRGWQVRACMRSTDEHDSGLHRSCELTTPAAAGSYGHRYLPAPSCVARFRANCWSLQRPVAPHTQRALRCSRMRCSRCRRRTRRRRPTARRRRMSKSAWATRPVARARGCGCCAAPMPPAVTYAVRGHPAARICSNICRFQYCTQLRLAVISTVQRARGALTTYIRLALTVLHVWHRALVAGGLLPCRPATLLWCKSSSHAAVRYAGACVAFGYVGSEAPTRLLRPPLPEHLDPVNKRSQQFRLEAAEFAAGKAPAHLFDAPDVTPATLLRVAAKATAEVDVPASFCGRVAADKPWHAHHDAEMDDEDEFKSMLMRDLR